MKCSVSMKSSEVKTLAGDNLERTWVVIVDVERWEIIRRKNIMAGRSRRGFRLSRTNSCIVQSLTWEFICFTWLGLSGPSPRSPSKVFRAVGLWLVPCKVPHRLSMVFDNLFKQIWKFVTCFATSFSFHAPFTCSCDWCTHYFMMTCCCNMLMMFYMLWQKIIFMWEV